MAYYNLADHPRYLLREALEKTIQGVAPQLQQQQIAIQNSVTVQNIQQQQVADTKDKERLAGITAWYEKYKGILRDWPEARTALEKVL